MTGSGRKSLSQERRELTSGVAPEIEEDGAAQEGGDGEDLRHHRPAPGRRRSGRPFRPARAAAPPRGRRGAPSSDQQRQEVVDAAEGDQRRQQVGLARQLLRHQQHHHRLEHPEPAGDLAQQARHLGEQEDAEEVDEGDPPRRRAAGRRARSPASAQSSEAMAICAAAIGGAGTAKSSPLKVNGFRRTKEATRKAAIRPRNSTADRPRARHRQVQSDGTAIGSSRNVPPESARNPEPEGDVAEQDDARDVDRRHPPARVEAGAQRGAGEEQASRGCC